MGNIIEVRSIASISFMSIIKLKQELEALNLYGLLGIIC